VKPVDMSLTVDYPQRLGKEPLKIDLSAAKAVTIQMGNREIEFKLHPDTGMLYVTSSRQTRLQLSSGSTFWIEL
jgi:hypothetical protein